MSLSLLPQASARPYEYIGMLSRLPMYAMCILSGFVSVACGPTYGADPTQPEQFADDPREAALIAADIYETEHGTLPTKCLADAQTAEFKPMDANPLGVTCNVKSGTVGACFVQYDVHGAIFAMDVRYMHSKLLHVHELLHLLLSCATNSAAAADGSHSDAVWYHLDGVNVGQYSGEPRE